MGVCGLANNRSIVVPSTLDSDYLQPPADAGVCIACAKCPEGYYISERCNGSTIFDSRKCAKCDDRCRNHLFRVSVGSVCLPFDSL